jgi:hypothetical protein
MKLLQQYRMSHWFVKWIQKLRGRRGSYSLPQNSITIYNPNRQNMMAQNLYNDEMNGFDSLRRNS